MVYRLVTTDLPLFPPHFKNPALLESVNMAEIFPGFVNYPDCFKLCLPYLLASAIYHASWLNENLCDTHPLFLSRFWRSDVRTRLFPHVVVGRGYCPYTQMHANGIPMQISLVNKVGALEARVQEIHETIISKLDGIASSGSPSDELRELFREHNRSFEHSLSVFMEDMHAGVSTNSFKAPSISRAQGSRNSTPTTHAWGVHPVPKTFKFPLCNTKRLWDLWFFGDECRFPYRKLQPLDMPETTDKVNLARARKVMKYLSDTALEGNIVNSMDVLYGMSYDVCDEVFLQV